MALGWAAAEGARADAGAGDWVEEEGRLGAGACRNVAEDTKPLPTCKLVLVFMCEYIRAVQ